MQEGLGTQPRGFPHIFGSARGSWPTYFILTLLLSVSRHVCILCYTVWPQTRFILHPVQNKSMGTIGQNLDLQNANQCQIDLLCIKTY